MTPTIRKLVTVVENPFAGRFVDDLTLVVDSGEELGALLAKRGRPRPLGGPAESYGKAARPLWTRWVGTSRE